MFIQKTNRKIIPRWRDFLTTAALGELASEQSPQGMSRFNGEKPLEEIRKAWTSNRTLWHALDLIGAAFVLDQSNDVDVKEAAAFILGNSSICPDPGLSIARRVLEPETDRLVVSDAEDLTKGQIQGGIHERRIRLQTEPRNSILWIDLARLYTIAGEREKAEKAIEVACSQSPDNRFVLRSAARFFLHIGESERALKLLRKSDAVFFDPWLIAAEIGISLFAGAPPRSVKPAKRLLEGDGISPFMATELASAFGTLELENGRNRLAKRLFQRSLTAPTENSLAQAEWATNQITGLEVNVSSAPDTPRTYEAKALHGFTHGNWDFVLENSLSWLRDQPFSSRPAGLASYVYSTMFDMHEKAESILRSSLVTNPGDRLLTNNLAFALINQGKTAEAEQLLGTVDPKARDDETAITLCATMGLLSFRKGEFQNGVRLYRETMELARHLSQTRYEALAALYLAREAILAKLPDSKEIVEEASEIAGREKDADVAFVRSRVLDFQKQSAFENV